MPSTPSTSSDAAPQPKGAVRRWLTKFTLVVVTLCVLAWAWQDSGMGKVGMLWGNADRAVNYIFGEKISEENHAKRLEQAQRQVRTQIQLEVKAALEAEEAAGTGAGLSLMELLRVAQEKADERIEQMDPGVYEALVQEEMDSFGEAGERRGGYFPIETSPRSIFGDPNAVDDLLWPASALMDTADSLPAPWRETVRWAVTALVGDGYTGKLLETVAIAIWGTLLAVFLALPCSLLGSTRSLEILFYKPGRTANLARWVGKFVIRRSYDIARGFNEIVLALIFVAVLGLGPLPGVMALFIHTYGVLGKVFADAIDTIDNKPVEGVQSTGAHPSHVVTFAVFPQIMPYVVSQSLLRFESNVRGATILGVVGAGGIGQMLMDKFGAYKFPEVATMMLIIIIVVTIIDQACAKVMKRFV